VWVGSCVPATEDDSVLNDNQASAPTATTTTRRSVWYGGRLITVLATSAETWGRNGVVEIQAWRDRMLDLPLHVQTDASVCCYVADGELAAEVGDRIIRLAAGSSLVIPQGVPHRLTVRSDWARLLVIYSPGGFEAFFHEVGEPAERATLPVLPAPVDVERLVTVAARYGVEIVAPAG
jgi:mannose-6-phosphate isomerase-like protein (cupin superfamily)